VLDSLHIHRFQSRHRVPDAAARQLAQDAQAQLLDGELEAALASVAPADEVVLLRRLSTRVRLSRRSSDRDNARAWGDSLALSLTLALQQAPAQDLLRFSSPQQALQAFAADVLQGIESRDWAWQRLGWLPTAGSGSTAQRRRALLRLLADDAEQAVPLLRGLLAGGLWSTLVAQLHADELRALAQAVLARLAGPAADAFGQALAQVDAASPATGALTPEPGAAAPELPAWWMPTLQAAAGEVVSRWALRLAAMLSQPALARRGAAAVDGQLAVWRTSGHAAASRSPVVPPEAPAATTQAPLDGPPATSAAKARDQADANGRSSAQAETVVSAAPAAAQAGPAAAGGEAKESSTSGTAPAAAPTTAQTQPVTPPDPTMPAGIEPQVGATSCGGLLLLAPLMPLCGALPLLEDTALWPDLPQALHQFALHLWPLAPHDPAALAFCGLQPLQAPPAPLHATPAQQAALQNAQALLLDHLDQRLPDWRGPGLLARVLCRPARISADPGWIEVIFPLRDVATELRRAALDLDPGFLPWLGVVLRYRYE
jgi:hypothetical protein